MNYLEFIDALKRANVTINGAWSWEDLLNIIILGFEGQAALAMRFNDKQQADQLLNRAQVLYDELKRRGYYNNKEDNNVSKSY